MNHFINLPVELHLLIFDGLPLKSIMALDTIKFFQRIIRNSPWPNHQIALTRKNNNHIIQNYKFVNFRIKMIHNTIIQKLSVCHKIYITSTNITDNTLVHLGKLKTAYITLYKCHGFTCAGLEHIKNCHYLDLSLCQITDNDLVHFSCHKISLMGCSRITDNGLIYVSKCCDLNIMACNKITDAGLVHLANCHTVYLATNKNITDDGIKYLTNCSNLNLFGCHQITGANISTFKCDMLDLSNCINLMGANIRSLKCHTLNISNCPNIIDDDIRHLKCKYLSVIGCPKISRLMVELLRSNGMIVKSNRY